MNASNLDPTQIFTPAAEGATPLCRIFGVRHLSPAAAHHLQHVLAAMKPTAVLVEGPSDATEHLRHLTHKDTQPPIALLCYTRQRPVRSIVYPLASYSPEWIALTWGVRNKVETRLIDLPSAVFLEMHQIADAPEEDEAAAAAAKSLDDRPPASEHTVAYLDDPYTAIAELCGDPDHETWWERHFEHTTDPAAYVRQIYEFGRGLRDARPMTEKDENLIREAYMRRCIREVLAAGHKPDKVLVVCGAFHAAALSAELPPMSDKEVKALPTTDVSVTLMPYSYFRLSSQSGYGAGTHAPSYFQRLFDQRGDGGLERLPARMLTELCHELRKSGQIRSAAEVIEAVRLATSLASLAESPAPCLRDLRDAAVCCLGRGEPEAVRPLMGRLEVGSAIGRLPKGVGRTSIQDDFYLQIEGLRLEKYLKDESQELTLDLREDRFVKGAEAAFRDLNRSTFLHRLDVLGVPFAEKREAGQQQATWKEIWNLRWRPESEITLVEGALLGDTVETAAAVRLAQRLDECRQVDEAAQIVRQAADSQLADALASARRRLQAMAVEESGLTHLAGASEELAAVVRYGSVRKVDDAPLRPLLSQLFLRATLAAHGACACDDGTAREQVQPALLKLNRAANEMHEIVDAERWNRELERIAFTDSLNAYLSGLVLSLILVRVREEELAREVSKRLSPGTPSDVAANWFEGLMQNNRELLFQKLAVWRQLDAFVMGLDEEGFRRSLVPLRRAMSGLSKGQVHRVVDILAEVSPDKAAELKAASVDVQLSDEEAKKLQEELGDLDLGI